MRKKLLTGIFALALLATAGYGVNQSMKNNVKLSDLALANVEALAFYEGHFDDLAALCEWAEGRYCDYYVVFPNGSGTSYSHWNMRLR